MMPRAPRPALALALRLTAEVLLTIGVVLALFVFYLLVWTNARTAVAQKDNLAEFRAKQSHGAARGASHGSTPKVGEGLSILHVPRLGADWKWVVFEGADLGTLAKGPGHFRGTAMPGEVGNYAIAGHRATHGEPFAELDRVVVGDKLYVEGIDGWYTYQVTWTRIVAPKDVAVIAPTPGRPDQAATARMMTLVTCHPRWGSTSRLVVGAQLVEQRALAAGPPAGLKKA